jgi:hypothetical protein
MPKPVRTLGGFALVAALAALGCENPQGFVEPTKHKEVIVDLFSYEMNGQQQEVYRTTVLPEPDMVHPHFEGRWTFSDNERPIDVYVIPAAYYNPQLLPAAQDSIFWSSLTDAVVGQQRQIEMHVHPNPGDWVIVLYNSLPFLATSRAKISTEIDLTYFK